MMKKRQMWRMRKNDLEGQIRLDQMYRKGRFTRKKAVRRLWMIARIFRDVCRRVLPDL